MIRRLANTLANAVGELVAAFVFASLKRHERRGVR